jgi:menaquinone-dependent protoporphyrinogen oxidase
MTRILIMYGTTDGHTQKVAERFNAMLREQGAVVDTVEAGMFDINPANYHGIVICASLHGGRYQPTVANWVTRHAEALRLQPTAFVSVCLGVLQKDSAVQRELDAIIEHFVKQTGWQPTLVRKVAGALRYRRYNFFKRWLMKRIVAKAGGDTDTSRDYEYTDWNDLRAFAVEFSRLTTPARLPLTAVAAG